MNDNTWLVYGIAAGVLLIIWVIVRLLTGGCITLKGLVQGEDGGLSTAQFQALLWTFLTFAAYIVVYTANAMNGNFSPQIDVPGNLLVLAGFSFATYIGANKVTEAKLEDKVGPEGADQPKSTVQRGTLGDLFTSDAGKGDLGKLQLMIWTMLAAALFIIQFHNRVVDMAPSALLIPDVDPSLLALVGLGQGAYLVKKAVVDDPKPTVATEVRARAAAVAKAEQVTGPYDARKEVVLS